MWNSRLGRAGEQGGSGDGGWLGQQSDQEVDAVAALASSSFQQGGQDALRGLWSRDLPDLSELRGDMIDQFAEIALSEILSCREQDKAWQQFYGCYPFEGWLGYSWTHLLNEPETWPDYTIRYKVDELEKGGGHPHAVVTYEGRQPKAKKWTNRSDVFRVKDGPCSLKGTALIDVEKAHS